MLFLVQFRGLSKLVKHIKWKACFSTATVQLSGTCKALVYAEYGDPRQVMRLQDVALEKLGADSVLLKMLASPINPADINMIQGTYPIKPSLPAVGGNEGVAEVVSCGDEVTDLKHGDWVVMATASIGCWSEKNVVKRCDVLKLPLTRGVSVNAAATLSVNPCTAYRMLEDFENMQPGDVVLQNGGNSGVGEAVIQLATHLGLVSVNVVRERENLDELKSRLMNLGASYVVTEKEFQNVDEMKKILKKHPAPKLALNCVGGKSSTQLIKYLSHRGSMVTYGGMSRKPITIPTSAFIFKDVKIYGFWMSQWNIENFDSPQRHKMLHHLCSLVSQGKLRPPECKEYTLDNFEEAILNAIKPYSLKTILKLNTNV